MGPKQTLSDLTSAIASDLGDWIDEGDDYIAQLDVGPEPGVILTTWASGAEFTIIVKED